MSRSGNLFPGNYLCLADIFGPRCYRNWYAHCR